MNDRELLEMAAKAAGVDGPIEEMLKGELCVRNKHAQLGMWAPLTDDGDALRLAVHTGEPFVVRTRCVTTMGGLKEDFDPAISGDDLRAVRRIIVRAAAHIVSASKPPHSENAP